MLPALLTRVCTSRAQWGLAVKAVVLAVAVRMDGIDRLLVVSRLDVVDQRRKDRAEIADVRRAVHDLTQALAKVQGVARSPRDLTDQRKMLAPLQQTSMPHRPLARYPEGAGSGHGSGHALE